MTGFGAFAVLFVFASAALMLAVMVASDMVKKLRTDLDRELEEIRIASRSAADVLDKRLDRLRADLDTLQWEAMERDTRARVDVERLESEIKAVAVAVQTLAKPKQAKGRKLAQR